MPLGAVEDLVATLWPGCAPTVVALSDPRRDETLVLVTEREGAPVTKTLDTRPRQLGWGLVRSSQYVFRVLVRHGSASGKNQAQYRIALCTNP